MHQIKAIGYPFYRTSQGMFNPISDIVENAKNKILNLLYTRKGERILSQNCQFGINLQQLLFENIGYSDYSNKIANELERSIRLWVKEVEKLDIKVNAVQNKLEIYIKFSVGQQNDTIFLELNLNETS